MGNWFEKEKRGLIMGIWSAHTSVGNIIGSVVASGVLEFGWGWSFMVPGVLVILVGIVVFLFLPVNPEDLGFESRVKENLEGKVESEEAGLLGTENVDVNTSPDTWLQLAFWRHGGYRAWHHLLSACSFQSWCLTLSCTGCPFT